MINKNLFLFIPSISAIFVILALLSRNPLVPATYLMGLLILKVVFAYQIPKNMGNEAKKISFIVFNMSITYLIIIMLYYPLIYDIPYIKGGSDDLTYERNALMLSLNGKFISLYGIEQSIHTVHSGYNFFLANLIVLIHKIGEYSTFLPRLINMLCIGLISGYLYFLGVRLGLTKRIAYIVSIAFGLYPITLFFSSFVLRDTLIAILTFFSAYVFFKSKNNKSIIDICLGIFFLVCMYFLRSFQVFIILYVFIFSYAIKKLNIKIVFRISLSIFIFFISLFIFQEQIFQSYRAAAGKIVGRKMLSDIVTKTHAERQDSGLSKFVFNQPIYFGIPARIGYALISPLPTFSNELTRLHISVGSLLLIISLPALIIGTIGVWHLEDFRWLPLLFWSIFIGVALTSSNQRQLIQVYPFEFLMIAFAWQNSLKKVLLWTKVWISVLIFLGLFYYFLKFSIN